MNAEQRHPPAQASPETRGVSPRRAARIAGWCLLAMAVIAVFAEIYVRQRLVVPGDPHATATNVIANELLLRFAIAGFVVVIILDVLVAWALYVLFKPVNRDLAVLQGWFRLVFAVIFAAAVTNLIGAVNLVGGPDYVAAAFESGQLHALMLALFDSFSSGWAIGLVFFGIHLLLIGYLVFRSGYLPRFLGILLAIAGLGYILDSFIVFFVPTYQPTISLFTFVGEVVLLLWLLFKAKTVPESASPPPVSQAVPAG